MKLSNLKYFVEIATENSFTKASQKLYISQPTLSRRIQDLEKELGVKLFDRSNTNKLSLSPEGEKVLTSANKIIEQVDLLLHMFDDNQEYTYEPFLIKIGCLKNFNFTKLYALLEEFKYNYKNIKILIEHDTPMGLNQGLIDGKYDIIFNLEKYLSSPQNTFSSFFMENHLQIALPLNHQYVNKNVLSFSDLHDEDLILIERNNSPLVFDYVINQCMKYGFNARANTYVHDLEEGLSKTSTGDGISFLYSGMIDSLLENKYRIKIISLLEEDDSQNIFFSWDKKNENNGLKSFINFIE